MLTGQQYKDSLKDGRKVYFEGVLMEDLETEPALGVPLQAIADGYDKYYSAGPDAVNPLTIAPRSAAELRARIPVITEMDLLLNVTYQSLMTLLVAAGRLEDHVPGSVPRIKAYVEDARRRDIRVTECITDAKGDRSLAPARQSDPDAYVRVVGRRPRRGGDPRRQAAHHRGRLRPRPDRDADQVDEAGRGGLRDRLRGAGRLPRGVRHQHDLPSAGRDPRDYPVSARASMPDSMVIFDDVFVPSERVFLDGQAAHAAVFAHSLGLWERLGGVSFMVNQADELVGLASLIAEANGPARVPHVREKIDEMMIHATLLRAGPGGRAGARARHAGGLLLPGRYVHQRGQVPRRGQLRRMVRHLHDIAGGAVVTAPSIADFDHPDLRPLLEKYMGTGPDMSGEYRSRLFHAIRDLTADAYGGWHHVTNLQSGGGLFAQRLVTRKHYNLERARAMALKAAGLSGA